MAWNIFPLWAGIVMLIAATASIWAAMKRERSTVAIATMALAILAMGGFIALLWATLERPPLRTMGETRLWYSFFILVSGLFTYSRWHYRWIMLFATVLRSLFIAAQMDAVAAISITIPAHKGNMFQAMFFCLVFRV